MALIETTNFLRFPDTSNNTFYAQIYNEDQTVGGGSIFANFYYGNMMHEIESPAGGEWRSIKTKGAEQFERGLTAVGGYYNIKNIQFQQPNTHHKYIDIQILTADFKGDEELKQKFDDWNATSAATQVKCCWQDGLAGAGFMADFTGMVRMVTYTKVNGQATDVVETFDGVLKNGARNGFGRYVNAEQRTSFVGALDGDYATYKGLYWKDFAP